MKPYIPMLKENNVRKGFFEREQFLTLRSNLPRWLQALLTFAYITGWRIRSEVKNLQWRQVDFKAGRVRLDPGTTKNDEGRIFPFTGELRELLEAQRQEHEALKKTGTFCPLVLRRASRSVTSESAGTRPARQPESQGVSFTTSAGQPSGTL